jgi:mannose-1-phosphate guanylyltransferase/phosphomannomutase
MNKAVIMAGGFGTRLRPLTMTIPKPMVPILNLPMMGHIVNLLKKYNITDVISLLYFQPEKITDFFEDGSKYGINMNYVMAEADYGTAGAVKNAYKSLDERFIIISGDVLTDFDISKAIEFHEKKKSMATLLLTRVTAPLQYGIVMTDEEGKITRFLEKPSWGQVFSDTINTGIYILEPEALDLIPYQEEFDFSKDLFPLMLSKGLPLYGYISEGYWKDVGNLNEYQFGQRDALCGDVNLGILDGNHGEVIISENAKVADTCKFSGKNLIGEGSVVGEHCDLSNTVIGKNCKIGNGVKLQGVTLWDNVEIGDFAELHDDVICSDTKIGEFASIAENVFIADNCRIGSKARLFSNIKLWPSKVVEDGSILSHSLVQEEKWQRELFTDARISGLSNIEINPEFGAKLGSAYGLTLGKNKTILASRDPDIVSRIMKRSITAGISSVGVNVNDLQEMSIPQTRQELRAFRYDGGIHIRKSPRDPEQTDVILFNKDGRDIAISQTKKIERFFFGEDIKRVPTQEVGQIIYPERTNEIYVTRYMESLNIDLIRNRKFKLLMDYSYGLASSIFPKILGNMNAEVISLHNYVDGSKFHPDPAEVAQEGDETGKIMRSLGYELGFRLQPGAEKISVIDERGRWYSHTRLLSIVLKLFLETNRDKEPYKIGVSIVAPQEVDEIAADYNVEIVRIQNNHSAMMDSTIDKDIKFVGGIYGGYIFSDFLFASDGMYTVGKVLEMLSVTGKTISDLDEELPRKYQVMKEAKVPWEAKGTVMRMAMEYSKNMERQLVEGVKVFEGDGNVLMLPAKEKGAFFVYAESNSEKQAAEIADKYVRLINEWKTDNN